MNNSAAHGWKNAILYGSRTEADHSCDSDSLTAKILAFVLFLLILLLYHFFSYDIDILVGLSGK
jgi:hypothetical protein